MGIEGWVGVGSGGLVLVIWAAGGGDSSCGIRFEDARTEALHGHLIRGGRICGLTGDPTQCKVTPVTLHRVITPSCAGAYPQSLGSGVRGSRVETWGVVYQPPLKHQLQRFPETQAPNPESLPPDPNLKPSAKPQTPRLPVSVELGLGGVGALGMWGLLVRVVMLRNMVL